MSKLERILHNAYLHRRRCDRRMFRILAGQDLKRISPAAPSRVFWSGLSTTTGNLHRDAKESADTIGTFLVVAFHFLALFVIGATTVWSAAAAFIGLVAQGRASLGDILLLFIYLGAANHRRVAPARRIV